MYLCEAFLEGAEGENLAYRTQYVISETNTQERWKLTLESFLEWLSSKDPDKVLKSVKVTYFDPKLDEGG